MKAKLIPSTLVVAFSLAGNCFALTKVTELFSAKSLDTSRWYQYNTGVAKFSQASGLLNFSVASNPSLDAYASLELLSSQPGFNESWQMTLDLSNTTNTDKHTGIGFMIFNVADRNDYAYVEFFGPDGVAAGAFADGKEATKRLSAKVPSTKGSIRVRFDKTTRLMSFAASLSDAKAGYKWVTIGTFSPTGKSGNVNANWKMDKVNGRFGIHLVASSAAKAVKSGRLTIDNFVLTTLK